MNIYSCVAAKSKDWKDGSVNDSLRSVSDCWLHGFGEIDLSSPKFKCIVLFGLLATWRIVKDISEEISKTYSQTSYYVGFPQTVEGHLVKTRLEKIRSFFTYSRDLSVDSEMIV